MLALHLIQKQQLRFSVYCVSICFFSLFALQQSPLLLLRRCCRPTTFSSSAVRISVTPWVLRPTWLTSLREYVPVYLRRWSSSFHRLLQPEQHQLLGHYDPRSLIDTTPALHGLSLGIQPAQYAYRNRFESQLGYRLRFSEQSVKPLDVFWKLHTTNTRGSTTHWTYFVLVKANNFARLRNSMMSLLPSVISNRQSVNHRHVG